jgi:WD40 repeat protein
VFGKFEVSLPELRQSFISPLGPSKGIRFAAVHPENSWVCGVTQDGVTVHDYETNETLFHLDIPGARAAFFMSKGNELMVVDNTHVRWFSLPEDEHVVKSFRAHSPRKYSGSAVTQTRVIRAGSFRFCQAADLSDDGHFLALMGSDKTYRDMTMVLDLETGKPVREFPRVFGFISVDISPDNQWVAVGSFNAAASRVWDLDSGKELIRIPSGNGSLVFNADGSLLADANFNQTDVYTTSDWQLQESIDRESFSDMPGLLAFSSDGKMVARTTSMRRIELLGLGSWELLASFTLPHPSVISHLNFSPDGRYLIAGTRSSIVNLLNVEQMEKNLQTMGLEWPVP